MTSPAAAEQPRMAELGTHRKSLRLSLACNQCRKRKVRCDAQQPKCRNCTLREEHCETSDPRRPGSSPAVRRRAAGRRQSTPDGLSKDPEMLSPVRLPPLPPTKTSGPVFAPSPASSSQTQTQPPRQAHNRGASQSGRVNSSRGVPESTRELRSVASASQASTTAARRGSHTTSPHELRRPVERMGVNDVSWLLRGFRTTKAGVEQSGPQSGQQPANGDVVVTPDVVVNTGGSPNRMKVCGGSSLQSLFNFVDLYLVSYGYDLTAPLFKHGMAHSEEFHMPLLLNLPNLLDRTEMMAYVDAYFTRVWPLFPAVDRHTVETEINALLELQGPDPQARLHDRIQRAQIPSLVVIYAIICIGMNEVSDCGSLEVKETYLTAGYSLHGHLTANPYLSSIQGLFLLSLALKGHCKDGQAWHMIGLAVRMGMSLGLQKPGAQATVGIIQYSANPSPSHNLSLRSRLWWSLFCLEKWTTLECGRPSGIDPDFDRLAETYGETMLAGSEDVPDFFRYFAPWVSLAGIMGQISDRLYSQRFCGSGHMLGETARLDQILAEWSASLPDHIWRRSILPSHIEDGQVLGAFLAQEYYHAQIAVLRVSIIFPDKNFVTEVRQRAEAEPRISRLLGGGSICVQAARSLIIQTLQLADSGIRSTLVGISQTFLATVVLALSILRQPGSRLARSDVELLASVTEHVETYYRIWGCSPAFTSILPQLKTRVTAVFRRAVDGTPMQEISDSRRQAAPGIFEVDSSRAVAEEQSQGISGLSLLLSAGLADTGQAVVGNTRRVENLGMMGETGTDVFNAMEFQELWNMMDADMFMYDTGDQLLMP